MRDNEQFIAQSASIVRPAKAFVVECGKLDAQRQLKRITNWN
jgi:hypothetical protein